VTELVETNGCLNGGICWCYGDGRPQVENGGSFEVLKAVHHRSFSELNELMDGIEVSVRKFDADKQDEIRCRRS
jgi:hypothetical protein